MIMEPCVALKRNICIYLIVYINFYSFTDLNRGSARRRGDFVYFVLFLKMLFHRGCCQSKSIASNMGWTATYSIMGRGKWFRGSPFSASWLWGDPAPRSPCPLACLLMGAQRWGWAVRPWRINQKALLDRVFSYILWLGLPKCTRTTSAVRVPWCSGWVGDARMFWVVLVTWYISHAGGSRNLFGECSFDLFTACKQAQLIVLTVNVIVIFLLYDVFFLSCLCSVSKSSTNLWLAGPQTKLVHTLIDSVLFFFIKCLLSVMNVFISGPVLTPAKNVLSVWDWGGGRTPFCYFFVLRISSWESKVRHKTTVCEVDFFLWENRFFFQLKENGFFLSYTWRSVRFLFHVIHYGCFLPMCSWVLTEWLHTRGVEL